MKNDVFKFYLCAGYKLVSTIIFVRFDAEDSYQASSRSHSFLEPLPIKTGSLTEGMDASALSSYFPSPSAGSCVLCI